MHVALVDSQGNVLASGASPGEGASVNEAIANFVPPAPGTYYALVTGAAAAAYNLVVTRDAVVSAGNNVAFASAEDITGTSGALGAIVSSASRELVFDQSTGE